MNFYFRIYGIEKAEKSQLSIIKNFILFVFLSGNVFNNINLNNIF